MFEDDFLPDLETLERALAHFGSHLASNKLTQPTEHELPTSWPHGETASEEVIERLAPLVLDGAARLDQPYSMAHMDPPTPWLTWVMAQWNARLNQNLLHAGTSPAAAAVERRVMEWLAPCFGMSGGLMTSGSTLSNLSALWAARERAGIRRVVASTSAHISIAKSANLLGLELYEIPSSPSGVLDIDALPDNLDDAALVLTAGTTGTGVIDPLSGELNAAWRHVDAAWAGPLQFTQYAHRLAGIEQADSVSVSAHKLLFQPKESALVMFREADASMGAISMGGDYLTQPNVGVQGSRGAAAIPLFATLLAWGQSGLAKRVEHCLDQAALVADWVSAQPKLRLLCEPVSGVVVWRAERGEMDTLKLLDRLQTGAASRLTLNGETWVRQVAANPLLDSQSVINAIEQAFKDG